MKILARHKWISGTTITESVDDNKSTKGKSFRRFTATIRGFRNWKIYEGFLEGDTAQRIFDTVKHIKDCIDNKDEGIFYHRGYFLK